jgi:hypothetical protein
MQGFARPALLVSLAETEGGMPGRGHEYGRF